MCLSSLPDHEVLGAGPCATEPCEPRQVRKEATVSGSFCVPQDHLAPLILIAEREVGTPVSPGIEFLARRPLV